MDRNELSVEAAARAPLSSGVTAPPVRAVVDYQFGVVGEHLPGDPA